ncbi:MAG: MBL fold metallo-hydrolase [Candidatus Kapaibacterium sp.]|jgi:anaerobic nitric oxide reductase flavorubredoxin
MFKITDRVDYVGKIDWQLRTFHGEQLTTNRGSSYNSYLIKDKKNVLIDTVWNPFSKEFIDNLEKAIGLKNIDYVIALHAEPDHSGALPYLMELIPDVPVYCTANGIKSLKGYYHKDWNFVPVKTGDVLDLGDSKITFVEATMLHWPDQLMAYFDKDEILFSSDAFGQHFATEFMYDDAKKIDMSELLFEAIKYYANIVAPYSSRVTQKLEEIKGFNLPVKIIAPSHGVMWRENPNLILEKYAKWADSYKEDQITIIYDTMYGSTRRMAECIAEGIRAVTPETTVKLFHFATADNSDVITEVFRSKAILVGSPTYNSGILSSIAALLEELKGMRLSGKKAAAFGSYGWAPISTKVIAKMLSDANFELMDPDNVKASWNPNEEAIKECVEFGKKFAEFAK